MTRQVKGTVGNPVRALVVDDSALFRRLVSELLEADGTIKVIDTAADAYIARRKIKELNPDVITLDVEMGGMDGITFLRHLMRLRPMPVVMVSSMTERGAQVSLDALSLGAVHVMAKPKVDVMVAFKEQGQELRDMVITASQVPVQSLRHTTSQGTSAVARKTAQVVAKSDQVDRVIAIGASTGGTEAVREILEQMPADSPCILLTQHIPASFSAPFAARLNRQSALTVSEARDGDRIVPGQVFVAPGGQHLDIIRSGTGFRCRLRSVAPASHHCPSVDVLFDSVANQFGERSIGVLLTGMGADGAEGLLRMRNAGAHTICQDQASSVVWGMPGAAVKLGAACEVLALKSISAEIVRNVNRLRNPGSARVGQIAETMGDASIRR